MRRILIGVIGGGDSATPEEVQTARTLGGLIARKGWVVINGGRRVGCMDASAEGAQRAGGLTIGLLPENHNGNASEFLDFQIITGLDSARNNLIALSSDLLMACSSSAGTLSEIALALKNKKNVILVGFDLGKEFYDCAFGRLFVAKDGGDALEKAQQILSEFFVECRPARIVSPLP